MTRSAAMRALRRRLPPLHTLTAFDAAARRGSFTFAADELCITQSAISQRIRILEEFLHCKLFQRLVRRVELTPAGARLAPVVSAMLEGLEQGCQNLDRDGPSTRLMLSVVSSFASRWLVPRLGGFMAEHPQFDVHVLSNSGFAKTLPDEIDAAILWGLPTDWPGMAVFRFMSVELFPVCTPALTQPRRGGHALRRPEDLRHHKLLRHSRRNYWPGWLAVSGLGDLPVIYGPEFDDASLALDAALHGQGPCISNEALAGDLIAAGQLVRPFRAGLPSDNSYYLVCREGQARLPKFLALHDWLVRTAGAA